MIMALPNSLLTAARSVRSPMYWRRPVILARSALTLSNSALGPAAIITPWAFRAAGGPMKTGQWRYFIPSAWSRSARSAVSLGNVVV